MDGIHRVLALNILAPYTLTCLIQMSLLLAAIEVSQQAACVLFDTEAKTSFPREFIKSKFRHTLFIGQTIKSLADPVRLSTKILLKR
jgi:dihydroorotase